MALSHSLGRSAMRNGLKFSHTKILTPQIVCYKTTRLLSSHIERSKRIPQAGLFGTILRSRSYWWSSSNSSAPSPSLPPSPTTPMKPSIPPAESVPTHAKELPVATATSPDPSPPAPVVSQQPTAQSDGVVGPVESSVSNPDGLTSDIPIPNSMPDVVPPIQLGDFADLGLTGWGLGGIFVRTFEWIIVFTGVAPFYAIILGTLFWRLAVVPFSIRQYRDAAKLRGSEEIANVRAAYAAARKTGDTNQEQIAALKVNNAHKKLGVNPFIFGPLAFVQLIPSTGVFLAIRNMCLLPVEQLKHSGVSFLPDLTLLSGTPACDPYYMVPILGVIAINLQMKFSMRESDPSRPNNPHYFNVFRILTPLMGLVSSYFPIGVALSILTGISSLTLQLVLLRLPVVRKWLGIPRLPPTSKLPSVLDTIKLAYTKVPQFFANFYGRPQRAPPTTSPKGKQMLQKAGPRPSRKR